MVTGRFIAVVGPSGVGKDSMMVALATAEPRCVVARRVISRPEDAGGEDFTGVDDATFAARKVRGDFALSWSAHGLSYGIPATVDTHLAQGRDVIANLSRTVLHWARVRFARTEVIALHAPMSVLAQRLAERGREAPDEITRRLARAAFDVPQGIAMHRIDNSGSLAATVAAVHAVLYPDARHPAGHDKAGIGA